MEGSLFRASPQHAWKSAILGFVHDMCTIPHPRIIHLTRSLCQWENYQKIVNFKNFTTSPLNSFYSPSYAWGREWKYLLKVYMMPKANLVLYCIATGTRESSIYSCFPFLLREDPLSIACGLPWCWFHRNNVVDSVVNSRLEELIVWCSWNFLKVF